MITIPYSFLSVLKQTEELFLLTFKMRQLLRQLFYSKFLVCKAAKLQSSSTGVKITEKWFRFLRWMQKIFCASHELLLWSLQKVSDAFEQMWITKFILQKSYFGLPYFVFTRNMLENTSSFLSSRLTNIFLTPSAFLPLPIYFYFLSFCQRKKKVLDLFSVDVSISSELPMSSPNNFHTTSAPISFSLSAGQPHKASKYQGS